MNLLTKVLMLANANREFFTMVEGHHNTEPSGFLEILITVIGGIIVVLVTIYTIRYFVKPREAEADHIKRRILEDGA
jgi:heme/copper-type cytochrome/quinol oxidase subunit 2